MKILLIDDDDDLRNVVEESLRRAGFEVTAAKNGMEGLQISIRSGHSFDLVVTDLEMPEKAGMEIIVELKKVRPNLKIIAMSGGGLHRPTALLTASAVVGADVTLAKPFSAAQLINAITTLSRK
jgi:DNA-binding response OmpR family regulator